MISRFFKSIRNFILSDPKLPPPKKRDRDVNISSSLERLYNADVVVPIGDYAVNFQLTLLNQSKSLLLRPSEGALCFKSKSAGSYVKLNADMIHHNYLSIVPHENFMNSVLSLLFMGAISIEKYEHDGIEQLSSLFIMKGNESMKLMTSHDDNINHEVIREEIKSGNADWGIFNSFYEIDPDDKPNERGIGITLVHPMYSISLYTKITIYPSTYDKPAFVDFDGISVNGFYETFKDQKLPVSRLMINYVDSNGVSTNRNVIRAEHVVFNGIDYIKGFCLLRFKERLFRCDRIIVNTKFAVYSSDRDAFFYENNLTHLISGYNKNKI